MSITSVLTAFTITGPGSPSVGMSSQTEHLWYGLFITRKVSSKSTDFRRDKLTQRKAMVEEDGRPRSQRLRAAYRS